MAQHLIISLRLYEDGFGTARYHGMSQGAPEWPPAPARVYQALIAGNAVGRALPEALIPALEWLEGLPPPTIAAPVRTLGQPVSLYVPNNDADSLADPRDVSSIRTAKRVQPSLFPADQPLLYAWALGVETAHSATIVDAANRIFQLGRGIDMAWASAQVLNDDALDALLLAYRGAVHRPETGTRGDKMLACPLQGSLQSLVERHASRTLRVEGLGGKARVLFTNPPKPRFASVSYAHTRRISVYELRDRSQLKPWPWALGRAAGLIEKLRDEAAARLQMGLQGDPANITRSLIGRAEDGSGAVPIIQRIHLMPLPSIGSVHADQAIRRVLVEVPTASPLSAGDVDWAFSGLEWINPTTGELSPLIVTKAEADGMLTHYTGPSRRWRSVTAVALPECARRRRIDPAMQHEQPKSARERLLEEERAAAAVQAALRHAGLRTAAAGIRVQREPFDAKGLRAEAFAEGTRFPKERLWHVEIELLHAVQGPLAIGDGRFIGLGVMAPVAVFGGQAASTTDNHHGARSAGLFALDVSGLAEATIVKPIPLARALRRAVMARVRDVIGMAPDTGLDRFFSGHEEHSTRADIESSRHLAFQWDAPRQRLLVIAPHLLQRRLPNGRERQHLQTLERAFEQFNDLRAGDAGRLHVRRIVLHPSDRLLSPSQRWTSVTPYAVTRHRRCSSADEALLADVLVECQRCGLPRPAVKVIDARGVPGHGLQGHVQLDFATAVAGPMVLGRTSHLGGGLFVAS